MSDIYISNKTTHSITTQVSDTEQDTTSEVTSNSIYKWNTVVSGSIPFSIVNIAYTHDVDPITGDLNTSLTDKYTSNDSNRISIYNSDIASRLECTGGILLFKGILDGIETTITIDSGNGIDFNNYIEGDIYALVDPKTIGQFSYDRYICGSAYCGYCIKQLVNDVK